MIDKFFYTFFGWVDKVSQSLPNIFKDEPKAKKEFLDVKNVAANVIVRKLYTNIGGT